MFIFFTTLNSTIRSSVFRLVLLQAPLQISSSNGKIGINYVVLFHWSINCNICLLTKQGFFPLQWNRAWYLVKVFSLLGDSNASSSNAREFHPSHTRHRTGFLIKYVRVSLIIIYLLPSAKYQIISFFLLVFLFVCFFLRA